LTAENVLTLVLLVAATAACIAIVWLSREVAATARSTRQLSDEVRERLIPLLEKADVTVDATNAELLRIDAAITRFEDASVRVGAASSTIADVVQAPADIVTGVADKVRRAWKDRREHASAKPDSASVGVEEPAAEADPSSDVERLSEPSEILGAHAPLTDAATAAVDDPPDRANIQAPLDA
jgi:hypothetical protein